jgi:type VI secretion system secreted protein VgrG
MTTTAPAMLKLTGNLVVTVASKDTLDVRQFVVQERMSTLFKVTLVALSENPDIDFDAVIGQPARFLLHTHDLAHPERYWSGVCSHLQQVAVEPRGLSTYQITLVPNLWLATQRRNYRMFQQLSELEIAIKVLREWGIDPRLQVELAAYKKRKYRVQYAENDFAFISRMLEDVGVSFYFEQEAGESRLVLAEAPQQNELRTPRIHYRDNPMVANPQDKYVTSVHVAQQVRPGKYTLRDHDYRKSPTYKLVASAEDSNVPVEERLERFHYTPGAFLFQSEQGGSTPVADDKGKHRTDEAEGATLARKRLDAKRGSAKVITFETNAHDLAPGVVMGFLDHPRSDLGDEKKLLIVQTTFNGSSSGEWMHSVEARGAEHTYRPPMITPKPKISGVESVTIVGRAGEEIHTDEFGRVRVHFHWDRESQMDDNSSCWIHVSQAWSGGGFGGVNLPRVGQEVLVDFLGGDPDRPVITGRVYTNLQKVPYGLPANKTQSGMKSASTHKTGGYNEIMMEDAAGKELLRMQAELDFDFLVKRNWTTTVGHDRTDVTRNDNTERVTGNQSVTVNKNREVTVLLDEKKTVIGRRDVIVLKDLMHAVKGSIAQSALTGSTTHTSSKMTVIESDESIVLFVGASSISITGEKITIQSPRVEINPGGGGGGGGE